MTPLWQASLFSQFCKTLPQILFRTVCQPQQTVSAAKRNSRNGNVTQKEQPIQCMQFATQPPQKLPSIIGCSFWVTFRSWSYIWCLNCLKFLHSHLWLRLPTPRLLHVSQNHARMVAAQVLKQKLVICVLCQVGNRLKFGSPGKDWFCVTLCCKNRKQVLLVNRRPVL